LARQRRAQRANWWFTQMRRVVDGAVAWQTAGAGAAGTGLSDPGRAEELSRNGKAPVTAGKGRAGSPLPAVQAMGGKSTLRTVVRRAGDCPPYHTGLARFLEWESAGGSARP
jgi:hypothetical protein